MAVMWTPLIAGPTRPCMPSIRWQGRRGLRALVDRDAGGDTEVSELELLRRQRGGGADIDHVGVRGLRSLSL